MGGAFGGTVEKVDTAVVGGPSAKGTAKGIIDVCAINKRYPQVENFCPCILRLLAKPWKQLLAQEWVDSVCDAIAKAIIAR